MFNQFEEIEVFFRKNKFTEEDLQFLKESTIEKYSDKEILSAALTEINLYVLRYKLTPIQERTADNNIVNSIGVIENEHIFFSIKPSRLVGKTVLQVSSILKVSPEKIIKIVLKRKISVSKVKNLKIKEQRTIELLLSVLKKQHDKNNKPSCKKKNKVHNRSVRLKIDFMEMPDVDHLKGEKKEVVCEKIGINIHWLHHIIKNKGIEISGSDKFNNEEFEAVRGFIASKLKAKIRNQKMFSYKRNQRPKKARKIIQSHAKGVYGKIENAGGVGKLIYIRSK